MERKEKIEIFGPYKGPKVHKKMGHDVMKIEFFFPSGASLKFRIGRSGETLEVAFSNDQATLKEQTKKIQKWLDFQEGEKTNQDRFDRLEKIGKQASSGAEFMTLIS
jgi:hypothetical protein